MASKKNRKKKIRNVINKLKEKRKVEGDPKIKGVDKPSKKQAYIQKLKREKAQRKQHGPKPTVVGPHGGVYAETSSGKKDYSAKKKTPKGVDRGASVKQRLANEKQKHVKKAVEDFLELTTLVKAFVKKHKGEKDDEARS